MKSEDLDLRLLLEADARIADLRRPTPEWKETYPFFPSLQWGEPFDSSIIPGDLWLGMTLGRLVAGTVILEMFSKVFSVAQGSVLGNRLACDQENTFLPASPRAAFYFLGSWSELPLLCGHEDIQKAEQCNEFRISMM